MSKSTYQLLDEANKLEPVKCDWCEKPYGDLYKHDYDQVCRTCLENDNGMDDDDMCLSKISINDNRIKVVMIDYMWKI